ncbi:MAG: hypothetical protein ABL966_08595 [Acidimicrobiales bacterium]
MRALRAATAAIGLGMAIALIPSTPAWACSCMAPDPSTQITIEITDSAVAKAANPFGGSDDFGATVDLRGGAHSVIGEVPVLLADVEVESVPVLAAVLDDPNMSDSCGTPQRPAQGSDIEVTGTVMDEGNGTFIWAGPCSGSFAVLAGPDAGFSAPSPPGDDDSSPLVPVAVGVGGLLVVALIAGGVLWRPRRES